MLLLIPVTGVASELTGTWRADDGGTYYLRQSGDMVHWYGEQSATNPRWANVFHGRIRGMEIRGEWMDIPKGQTMGQGVLRLRVLENGNVLEATHKSGGFGGSRWLRADARPAPRPLPPVARPARPMVQPRAEVIREDCIAFDPGRISVEQLRGSWKVVEGNHWLFDFGGNRDEARSAYRIIRHYRMNQSCFVGRPNPSFTYMLSNNTAPAGSLRGEDCVAFDPARLSVERLHGSWKVVEGNHWLFDFGPREDEARQTLSLIRKYGFTKSCFVGRPQPSFKYLRR